MARAPCILYWLDDMQPYREALDAAGLADRVEVLHRARSQAIEDEARGRAEAMVCWSAPAGMLAGMPALRWIQTVTVGVSPWLVRDDLRDDIVLTCARGVHDVQMPENILGVLFWLTKPIAAAVANQREHHWQRLISTPLAGQTLGILGVGAIGGTLARHAKGLGMRVLGTRRSGEPHPHVDAMLGMDETELVLSQADYVVLLMPATSESEGLIDARRLRAMKPTAWLLNFARGELVVDHDLLEAVREQRLAGAVLDVFRDEPLPPDHPFWSTPGIIVLPHLGGLHPQRDRIVAEMVTRNVANFVDGRPLEAVVDRGRGY